MTTQIKVRDLYLAGDFSDAGLDWGRHIFRKRAIELQTESAFCFRESQRGMWDHWMNKSAVTARMAREYRAAADGDFAPDPTLDGFVVSTVERETHIQ